MIDEVEWRWRYNASWLERKSVVVMLRRAKVLCRECDVQLMSERLKQEGLRAAAGVAA